MVGTCIILALEQIVKITVAGLTANVQSRTNAQLLLDDDTICTAFDGPLGDGRLDNDI